MNEQNYIGSFDPYEQEEFIETIIRVNDGMTGLPIMATAKMKTNADIIAYVTASIQASYDKNIVVIHIEKESTPYRWNR